MFVVALVDLRGPLDAEVAPLAADLGVTAYESGLLLRAGSPAVLLRTEDRERALDLLGRVRARGHDVVACDASAVVSSEDMTLVRSVRFDPDGLANVATNGVETVLPFASIFALVRAAHHTRSELVETSKQRKLSFGRAALTGGLVNTKTVTKETRHTTESREAVLYVFRTDGPPWFFDGSRARYEGLGPDLRPSKHENFELVVTRLRERAPHAFFDERILALHGGGADRFAPAAVDLLSHVIAASLARTARERNRGAPHA